jgi:hypothetical protein
MDGLKPYFGQTMQQAAAALNIRRHRIKEICDAAGATWPVKINMLASPISACVFPDQLPDSMSSPLVHVDAQTQAEAAGETEASNNDIPAATHKCLRSYKEAGSGSAGHLAEIPGRALPNPRHSKMALF